MPPTIGSKIPEATGKKPAEFNNENDIKKLHSVNTKDTDDAALKEKENETGRIGPENRTRYVRKNSAASKAKTTKPGEDAKNDKVHDTKRVDPEKSKRISSAVLDKIPKKNAQRAKGSLSIKPTERVETDSLGKKRPSSSSLSHFSLHTTNIREGEPVLDVPPENAMSKHKIAEKPVRVRSSRKIKSGKSDSKEDTRKGTPKKRKPWVSVIETPSGESVEKETQPIAQEVPDEKTNAAVSSPNCSFFEKLQQGLKSYFSSRSSIKTEATGDDKNKKKISVEGIQTKPGVAKGVKEERKKRKPKVLGFDNGYGFKLKNKNINSESGLSEWPRLSLTSSHSGGKLSSFFETKPINTRNFCKLKQKQIYHPKTNYVSIQKPRKGYFYRSYVQIKTPESTPRPERRLAPVFKPKDKSKIQIARLAPASPKGPDICQKRMKDTRETLNPFSSSMTMDCDVRAEGSTRSPNKNDHPDIRDLCRLLESIGFKDVGSPNSTFPPEFLEDVCALIQSEANLELDKYSLGNWPHDTYLSLPSQSCFYLNQNVLPSNVTKNDEDVCDLGELACNVPGSYTSSTTPPKRISSYTSLPAIVSRSRRWDDSTNDIGVSGCVLGYNNENLKQKSSESSITMPPDSAFETLVHCLNSALGAGPFTSDLEIISLTNSYDTVQNNSVPFSMRDYHTAVSDYEPSLPKRVLHRITEEPADNLNDVFEAYDHFDDSVQGNDSTEEEEDVTMRNVRDGMESYSGSWMGDIDLHWELENYLKSINALNKLDICRVETKPQDDQYNYDNFDLVRQENFRDYDRMYDMGISISNLNDMNDGKNEDFLKKGGICYRTTDDEPSSSFFSATSFYDVRDSVEKDYNKLQALLDQKNEIPALKNVVSEECMDSRPARILALETHLQILEQADNKMQKTKSENDISKLQQEKKCKNCIKRTCGKTSFQITQMDDSHPLRQNSPRQPPVSHLIFKRVLNRSESAKTDVYEKVLPLKTQSLKTFKEKAKKKFASNVLYKNSSCSFSNESLKSSQRPVLYQTPSAEDTKTVTKIDRPAKTNMYLAKKTQGRNKYETPEPSKIFKEEKTKSWTPNLQELADIYNSVLRHHRKLRNNSSNSTKRCLSNMLLSFVDCKLREKKCKSDLLKHSKHINTIKKYPVFFFEKYKERPKKNLPKLQEYVNVFQEILLSSLTINQITKLNDVIAGAHEISSNYQLNTPKSNKQMIKGKADTSVVTYGKKKLENIASSPVVKYSSQEDVKRNPLTCKRKFCQGGSTGKPKEDMDNKTQQNLPKHLQRNKVPCLGELETVLKSLSSGSVPGYDSNFSLSKESDRKLVLTVKLSGDKIIVIGLSDKGKNAPSTSQESLPGKKLDVSELLVENVINKQSADQPKKLDVSKKTKTRVFTQKQPQMKHSNRVMSVNKAKPLSKTVSEKKLKLTESENKCNALRKTLEPTPGDTKPQSKQHLNGKNLMNEFFYSKHQLKTQHPMEAIIEGSENLNDFVANTEEKLEKALAKNTVDNLDIINQALRDNSVFSKDLVCEFNSTLWDQDESEKGWPKSINRPLVKNVASANLKNNQSDESYQKCPEAAKSLDDSCLRREPKNVSVHRKKVKKALPLRPILCYPSFQNLQNGKLVKNKKKGREAKDVKTEKKLGNTSHSRVLHPGRNGPLHKAGRHASKKSEQPKSSDSKKPSPNISEKNSTNTIEAVAATSVVNPDNTPREYNLELLFNEDNLSRNTATPDSVSLDCFKHVSTKSELSNQSATKEEEAAADAFEKHPESEFEEWCIEKFEAELNKALQQNHAEIFQAATSSRNSMVTVKNGEDSSIIIHCDKKITDFISFPSLVIQSDSFLRYCSSLQISRSQLLALFQSNSDRKFHSGRVMDNGEEEHPFVTFVLTPKQKAEVADVPPNQVIVVSKDENPIKQPQGFDAKESEKIEDVPSQKSLKSIEKFIDFMSKNCTKKKKVEIKKPPVKEPKVVQKKCMAIHRLREIDAARRKAFHDCQKKQQMLQKKIKKRNDRISPENKDLGKKFSEDFSYWLKDSKAIVSLRSQSQKGLGRGEFHKALEHFSVECNQRKEGQASHVQREVDPRNVEGNIYERTTRSLTQISNPNKHENSLRLTPDLLILIKKALIKMETFKSKQAIIEALDNHLETLRMAALKMEQEKENLNNERETNEKRIFEKEKRLESKIETRREVGTETIAEQKSGSDHETRTKEKTVNEAGSTQKTTMQKDVGKGRVFQNVAKRFKDLKSLERSSKILKDTKPKKLKTFNIKIHCGQSAITRPKVVGKGSKVIQKQGRVEKQEKLKDIVVEPVQILPKPCESLLDSLIKKEPEDPLLLGRTPSDYFDAEEQPLFPDLKDLANTSEETFVVPEVLEYYEPDTITTTMSHNSDETSDTEDDKEQYYFMHPSDECFHSRDSLPKENDEIIFQNILQKSDNAYYSMILIEGFLNKTERSGEDKTANLAKLRKILQLIETKSEKLMYSMEKNGWFKILSLLEEVSKVFEVAMSEEFEIEIPLQSETSKSDLFAEEQEEKIHQPKLVDSFVYLDVVKSLLRNLQILRNKNSPTMNPSTSYSSKTQSVDETPKAEETQTDLKKVLCKIKDSFLMLKSKLTLNWSQTETTDESESEEWSKQNNVNVEASKESITQTIFEVPSFLDEASGCDQNQCIQGNQNILQQLKEEIRKQKLLVLCLINDNSDRTSAEIRDIKAKVADKMMALEKALSLMDDNVHKSPLDDGIESCKMLTSKPGTTDMERSRTSFRGTEVNNRSSYLNLAMTYKNFLDKSNTEIHTESENGRYSVTSFQNKTDNESPENSINFVPSMKSLLKV